MSSEILELILESAEDSFLEVAVFVGAVLLLFSYIDYRLGGGLIKRIEKSKRTQPIIGALLGLTPGCGGAIFVVPLFSKGTITFGTIVATMIATMGDSAFVLMSMMPMHYLLISVISFIVAVIIGYIVDFFELGDDLFADMEARRIEKQRKSKTYKGIKPKRDSIQHIGHGEDNRLGEILHASIKGHQKTGTLGYEVTHKGYSVYWLVLGIGLILGILDLFQVDLNTMAIPNLGTIVGVSGTVLSIFLMFMGKKFIQNHTHEESEMKIMSLKETLVHSAQETAFIATWVFAAFLVYELTILAVGSGSYEAGELVLTNILQSSGLKSVVVGALIGIIPGCGPQIIFVSLYTKGMIPFAALLANAISQDGDALFPLLAIDKRTSFWVVLLNTIAGLVVGIIIYFIEINIGIL